MFQGMIIEKNFLVENASEEKHFNSGFKYNNWSEVEYVC